MKPNQITSLVWSKALTKETIHMEHEMKIQTPGTLTGRLKIRNSRPGDMLKNCSKIGIQAFLIISLWSCGGGGGGGRSSSNQAAPESSVLSINSMSSIFEFHNGFHPPS